MTRWPQTIEERFWAKVDKTEGCWNWTASVSELGYGRFFVDGTNRQASRIAYGWITGAIPEGLELDHLCRNTHCVNPDHLEPVTHAENVRRGDLALGIRSAITHCAQGHEFTPENTAPRPRNGSVQRRCRKCTRRWVANAQRRKKERATA